MTVRAALWAAVLAVAIVVGLYVTSIPASYPTEEPGTTVITRKPKPIRVVLDPDGLKVTPDWPRRPISRTPLTAWRKDPPPVAAPVPQAAEPAEPKPGFARWCARRRAISWQRIKGRKIFCGPLGKP